MPNGQRGAPPADAPAAAARAAFLDLVRALAREAARADHSSSDQD